MLDVWLRYFLDYVRCLRASLATAKQARQGADTIAECKAHQATS